MSSGYGVKRGASEVSSGFWVDFGVRDEGGVATMTHEIPVESLVLFAAVALVGAGLIVGVALLLRSFRGRKVVGLASRALADLEGLNLRYHHLLAPWPSIRVAYPVHAASKAKFDRFDLHAFQSTAVLETEQWYEFEIANRIYAVTHFGDYHREFEALGAQWLGRSEDPRIGSERFAAIELKLFYRRKIDYPWPLAEVSTTVMYTSPKGQNSYSRRLVWNFDQLVQGIRAAQALRAHQSTVGALRQRERSLMTAGLRMKILRRDEYRCQMCGASASDGVTLHVDHISPVSHGGRTEAENLRTLCQTCNLGKGNRFSG